MDSKDIGQVPTFGSSRNQVRNWAGSTLIPSSCPWPRTSNRPISASFVGSAITLRNIEDQVEDWGK